MSLSTELPKEVIGGVRVGNYEKVGAAVGLIGRIASMLHIFVVEQRADPDKGLYTAGLVGPVAETYKSAVGFHDPESADEVCTRALYEELGLDSARLGRLGLRWLISHVVPQIPWLFEVSLRRDVPDRRAYAIGHMLYAPDPDLLSSYTKPGTEIQAAYWMPLEELRADMSDRNRSQYYRPGVAEWFVGIAEREKYISDLVNSGGMMPLVAPPTRTGLVDIRHTKVIT